MGHVRPGSRGRNHILSDKLEPAEVARLIDVAIASRNPASVLERLAPANSQYASLRKALAALPPGKDKERRQIEVNLERLRWMPRKLGNRGSAIVVGRPALPVAAHIMQNRHVLV